MTLDWLRSRRAQPPEPVWSPGWGTASTALLAILGVAGLLEVLRRNIIDLDERSQTVWRAGSQVAQKTQAVHLLQATKERSAELLAELERHRRLWRR